ncbi:hypothetical protein ACFWDF_35115, partial [Streptomyces diastaticus]|uniref:hypothetical protein n=1 Tax=Streptomyces diastaticus TaxID=1956 RepID=UPI0036B1C57C
MTHRPQQRAPKGRDRDRADRRAVVDVLLARAQRGALTPAEGALLAEHVREEQRLGDESRRAMAGTTQALDRHRAAADDAIHELEQRAERAEHENSILRAVDEGRSHGARRVMNERNQARTALDASRRNVVEAAHEARKHKHRADRYRLAWLAARRDRKADRAAMAADLATLRTVQAERDRLARTVEDMHDGINQTAREAFAERKRHRGEVRALREQLEQLLAAVRAALPDEPRP